MPHIRKGSRPRKSRFKHSTGYMGPMAKAARTSGRHHKGGLRPSRNKRRHTRN